MVDQKFVCVTFILLIVGSCVNSLPQFAANALIENSSNSSNTSLVAAPSPPLRNVIVVPNNCPEGQKMAIDGVCREVF